MPETSFRAKQIIAFLLVYLIWGSTYLAIRFAIETLPGFLMVGVRFLISGALLYGWARWRGAAKPQAVHWRSATFLGGLLLLCGNGGVVWSEHHVDSGLVALIVGTVPLWVAIVLWVPGLLPGPAAAERPRLSTALALLVGFAGVGLLVAPGGEVVHLPSVIVVVFASAAWAYGSVWGRTAPQPESPALATAMQMLTGGGLLVAAGTVTGEWQALDLAGASTRSWLGLLYLIVFGSLIAFTAYIWLVRTTEPTLVSTYAYVNPVVAVFLGWWLADEAVYATTLVAAALIIGSVVAVTLSRRRPAPARAPAASAPVATPPPHRQPELDKCA